MPEPTDEDAEIDRLRADQTSYHRNLTEIAQQHVKDLDRLRAELSAVAVALEINDADDLVGQVRDISLDYQNVRAELAAAHQEIARWFGGAERLREALVEITMMDGNGDYGCQAVERARAALQGEQEPRHEPVSVATTDSQ